MVYITVLVLCLAHLLTDVAVQFILPHIMLASSPEAHSQVTSSAGVETERQTQATAI